MIVNLRGSYLNISDAAIGRSIHLAVQLWLCLSVYSQDNKMVGSIKPRESRVHWTLDEALDQMVASQCPASAGIIPSTTYQIDGSFTLAKMKSICGLQIRWTNNLKDHLRLEGQKGQRTLSVYQHRKFLVNHYYDPEFILPKPMLREAIRTLDLLLPYEDSATEKLIQDSKITLGVPLEGRQAYDLEEFTYWRGNLVQLLDILHGPPESLFQTLRDTRNMFQWATIWIAVFGIFVLTLVFGCLTTVYSILQYRVTVKSYELSLAVACQQRTGLLPGFCD
ncbi:uncharacterized protein BDV17DRAFT_289088 [Aspergillus undulatus]|uniref:uncharacterized protein n=1 Tax=Aspergillus undulatus TaxID=1810928 RepID=UPI003CCCA38F